MRTSTPMESALRVLALRDHSEAELRRKLKEKGFSEGVEEAVARLKELGYLDDARFARSFAASAVRNGRGFGSRIKLELARRGVAEAVIRETLREIDEEFDEGTLLRETLERRFASFDAKSAPDKEKRKVVGYLSRKGFSLRAIFAALNYQSID
ncbi:regulatory protein RecX [Geomonas silvestris]|uniref:Regulatory protein RecX n=1 Tax=Geomonas silvestris TaxID=2740184 RepID=A0A6V8MGP6_9BACT|nr:regulatory protein RecX [Geomonas silvestris]GFO59161.1 regulatory protein RecX [Geomonas silvestris]